MYRSIPDSGQVEEVRVDPYRELAEAVRAGCRDTRQARGQFVVYSITDPPGANAYPICSFTWTLLPSVIADSAKHGAIIEFLQWGLTKGQEYLEPLGYARLPSALSARADKALTQIKSSEASQAAQYGAWSFSEASSH